MRSLSIGETETKLTPRKEQISFAQDKRHKDNPQIRVKIQRQQFVDSIDGYIVDSQMVECEGFFLDLA